MLTRLSETLEYAESRAGRGATLSAAFADRTRGLPHSIRPSPPSQRISVAAGERIRSIAFNLDVAHDRARQGGIAVSPGRKPWVGWLYEWRAGFSRRHKRPCAAPNHPAKRSRGAWRGPRLRGSDPYQTRAQGLLAPHHAQNRRVMGTPQSRPGLTSVSPSGLGFTACRLSTGVPQCGRL